MSKARKRGKEARDESEQLTRVMSFRLTEPDHEQYLARIESSGRSRSEFFRECVLGNKTEVIAKVPASANKLRLLFLYNKTSNNINQLAYRAHHAYHQGRIDESLFANVFNELSELKRLMRDGVDYVD